MSEWKEYKLKDIGCSFLSGFAFKSTDYKNEGIPLIKIGNIQDRIVHADKSEDFISNDIVDEKLSKYLLEDKNVVIAMTGQGSVGRVGRIRLKNNEQVLLNQRVGKFICDEKNINLDYLFYVLASAKYQDALFNAGSGSGQPNLSPELILSFEIPAPDYKVQSSIASILSSLDDKIDLLHRQNKTLEQLAETLFRQWFVEEAEESWGETNLYDAVELVGGGTPKTEVVEYWDGNLNWLSGGDISSNHKNFVMSSEKKISKNGLENSSANLLPKFATVISARGTVGKYCILSEPMTFSQSNYGIIPRYKNCFFFTYSLIAHSVDELLGAAYGSVFDTITTNTFKETKLRLPSQEKINEFEETVKPYFQKMLSNQAQIRTLTQLRDTLLPKLMSGEVRVTE